MTPLESRIFSVFIALFLLKMSVLFIGNIYYIELRNF